MKSDSDNEREQERIRQQQMMEQNAQASLNLLPDFYFSMYERYQKAGFTKDESFRLVCCQVAGGVRL